MAQYRCPTCDRMVTPKGGFSVEMLGQPCRECQLGHVPPPAPRVQERSQKKPGQRVFAISIIVLLLIGGAVSLSLGSKPAMIVGGIVLGLGILLGLAYFRGSE